MSSAKAVQEVKPLVKHQRASDGTTSLGGLDKEFSLNLQPGRPDINKLFDQIAVNKKGSVSVFFCGNRELGSIVQEQAINHNFNFYKEHF